MHRSRQGMPGACGCGRECASLVRSAAGRSHRAGRPWPRRRAQLHLRGAGAGRVPLPCRCRSAAGGCCSRRRPSPCEGCWEAWRCGGGRLLLCGAGSCRRHNHWRRGVPAGGALCRSRPQRERRARYLRRCRRRRCRSRPATAAGAAASTIGRGSGGGRCASGGAGAGAACRALRRQQRRQQLQRLLERQQVGLLPQHSKPAARRRRPPSAVSAPCTTCRVHPPTNNQRGGDGSLDG